MPDINNPVDLAEYADVIAANPNTDSKHWSLPCYNDLKAYVREHYSVLQNDICCYCKISLRHGGYGEPIEHVVPKADRPQWMFIPRNLALSCYPCNTKKNADNTLSATGLASHNYPTLSADFTIYHPHFDTWSEHIEIYHEYFLRPTSPKGISTFEICELYRFNLPLDKAKQKNWEEEPFKTRVIEQVLLDATASDEIRAQCDEITKEIIRRAKIRHQILNANNPAP
jgi:uncharacterized protein (TIGR02646 family)